MCNQLYLQMYLLIFIRSSICQSKLSEIITNQHTIQLPNMVNLQQKADPHIENLIRKMKTLQLFHSPCSALRKSPQPCYTLFCRLLALLAVHPIAGHGFGSLGWLRSANFFGLLQPRPQPHLGLLIVASIWYVFISYREFRYCSQLLQKVCLLFVALHVQLQQKERGGAGGGREAALQGLGSLSCAMTS